MKEMSTRKILEIIKILLFVYIASSILVNIGNIFDISFLNKLFSHFDISISITSAILYVYLYKKGEKKIASTGILLLLVCYACSFIQSFGLFSYTKYILKEFPSIILYPIYSLLIDASSIYYYIALYSLIKCDDPDVNQYKKIHIYLCIASAVLGLINPLTDSSFIRLIVSIISDASYLFFALVLITYFLHKEDNITYMTNNIVQNSNMMGNNMNSVVNQNANVVNNNMNSVAVNQNTSVMNNSSQNNGFM